MENNAKQTLISNHTAILSHNANRFSNSFSRSENDRDNKIMCYIHGTVYKTIFASNQWRNYLFIFCEKIFSYLFAFQDNFLHPEKDQTKICLFSLYSTFFVYQIDI
jgi:hypothetical protein